MKKFLLLAVMSAALLTAWGCKNGHDRNDDTGHGEKQDRLDTTTGKMPNP